MRRRYRLIGSNRCNMSLRFRSSKHIWTIWASHTSPAKPRSPSTKINYKSLKTWTDHLVWSTRSLIRESSTTRYLRGNSRRWMWTLASWSSNTSSRMRSAGLWSSRSVAQPVWLKAAATRRLLWLLILTHWARFKTWDHCCRGSWILIVGLTSCSRSHRKVARESRHAKSSKRRVLRVRSLWSLWRWTRQLLASSNSSKSNQQVSHSCSLWFSKIKAIPKWLRKRMKRMRISKMMITRIRSLMRMHSLKCPKSRWSQCDLLYKKIASSSSFSLIWRCAW